MKYCGCGSHDNNEDYTFSATFRSDALLSSNASIKTQNESKDTKKTEYAIEKGKKKKKKKGDCSPFESGFYSLRPIKTCLKAEGLVFPTLL